MKFKFQKKSSIPIWKFLITQYLLLLLFFLSFTVLEGFSIIQYHEDNYIYLLFSKCLNAKPTLTLYTLEAFSLSQIFNIYYII